MEKRTREPFVGELISTSRGGGCVVGLTRWNDISPNIQKKLAAGLRSQLGNSFIKTYFRVSVEFEDGDTESFHCWEVDYDTERDPEDAPWREPRPDSESGA